MFAKKMKKHPYVKLTVVSLAAAGVINLAGKMKRFLKQKVCCMKDIMGKMMGG